MTPLNSVWLKNRGGVSGIHPLRKTEHENQMVKWVLWQFNEHPSSVLR
jgi:hypothetical protein